MPKGYPQGEASAASLAAQRRRVAEEYISEIAELASLMVDVLGVDLIRGKLGRERALRVLKLSGRDADRIGGSWADSEPVRRQVSEVRPDAGYDRDPRHSPAVVKAILAGAPFSEINDLIKEAQDELLAHPPPTVGPPGFYPDSAPDTGAEMGVSYATVRGPDGLPVRVPVQKSVNYASWEQLHAQDPAVTANGLGLPQPANGNGHPGGHWQLAPEASVTECSHEAQDGHRYCDACGTPLPLAAATTEGDA